MFEVKTITVEEAHKFSKEHQFNLFINKGYEGTKYEFAYRDKPYDWYGVFENDNMVAIQVAEIHDEDAHLISLQKVPGTSHGVFESIMNYFDGYNIHFKAYDEKLQKMYKSLGFTKIKDFDFVKYK